MTKVGESLIRAAKEAAQIARCKLCGGTGRVERHGADGSYLAFPCPTCRPAPLQHKEAKSD